MKKSLPVHRAVSIRQMPAAPGRDPLFTLKLCFAMAYFPVFNPARLPLPSGAASAQQLLADQFGGAADLTSAERQALGRVRGLLAGQPSDEAQTAQRLAAVVPGMTNAVTYRPDQNAFVGTGYTSAAGNTYFSTARLTAAIAIRTDIGIGYARVFLNAIHIYSADGQRRLLAHRDYHCCFYSEQAVMSGAIALLRDLILDSIPADQRAHAEADARLLAERIVREAYTNDQVQLLRTKTALLD
ncbi:MAG: hypothetical protein KIS77_22360 [Saprospiraceae bacterium]|nr:hypothetical protein [Saprospiraceae bacterium]